MSFQIIMYHSKFYAIDAKKKHVKLKMTDSMVVFIIFKKDY